VASLKLPVLAINIAIACLLIRVLVVDAGLRPVAALVASLFFVLAPPIAASRLVEASGGNIEPLLYVLLLWVTRRSPVAFGLIAGVGIMNREFTIYGVVAILVLDFWHGRFLSKDGVRHAAIVFAEIVAVAVIVRWLKGHADLLGPQTAGTLPPEIVSGQLDFWTSRVCWNLSALGTNARWLFAENLTALFGWRSVPFSDYFVSRLNGGHLWALGGMAALFIAASVSWIRRDRAQSASELPAFLVLVGLQAIAVYALASCLVQERALVRYTLLALFIPIGILTWLLRRDGATSLKTLAIGGVLVWSAASALDSARLLDEYFRHPPPNRFRELADFLEREGIKYADAPYWTAYHLDFLTDERVVVSSYEKVRVEEYQTIVKQHIDESATIYFNDPCRPDEDGVNFRQWCVGYISRARHPRP
jgi:hypothetical protein